MRRFADDEKKFIARQLRRGLGFRGQLLAQKKGFGRLGVDDSIGGLPASILRGRTRSRPNGFDVVFSRLVDVFDEGASGSRNQPPRRIVGISLRRRKILLRALALDVARQMNRSGG